MIPVIAVFTILTIALIVMPVGVALWFEFRRARRRRRAYRGRPIC